MLARLLIAASVLSLATPAAADWTHKESGVSLPDAIGDMRGHGERDLSNGERQDVWIQYGTDTEPVTLYVYRSSFPNPALWFERTRTAMLDNVGAFDTAPPPRAVAVGGPAPNALRAEYPLAGTPWKATAVALVGNGEWIVKARVTSQTLDPAGVARRMDRFLAAIRFAKQPADPLPLTAPAACTEAKSFAAQPKTGDQMLGAGAALGLVAFGEARGMVSGLARKPGDWCRAELPDPAMRKLATLYRSNDGNRWTALLGDAGLSLQAIDTSPGMKDQKGGATYITRYGPTQLVATWDGVPDFVPALAGATPVLRGQAKGLATIGVGKK